MGDQWSIWCGGREVVRFGDPRMWALASEVARQAMELGRVVPVILLAMEDEDLSTVSATPEAPVVVVHIATNELADETIREVARSIVLDVFDMFATPREKLMRVVFGSPPVLP